MDVRGGLLASALCLGILNLISLPCAHAVQTATHGLVVLPIADGVVRPEAVAALQDVVTMAVDVCSSTGLVSTGMALMWGWHVAFIMHSSSQTYHCVRVCALHIA